MGARHAWPAAVSLWVGLVLAAPLLPPGAVALTMGLAALGPALLASRRAGPATLVAALLASGLARGGAALAREAAVARGLPAAGAWRLVGVVAEPPRRESGAPSASVRVLRATPRLVAGTCVRLRLPPGALADWGDTVEVFARLDPPGSARVPGARPPRLAARAGGLAASGRAFTLRLRPTRDGRDLPVRIAMRVRRAAESALARTLDPRARELAAPLLFGDRSGVDPATGAALRASGLVHLLALSGLHVGWVAGGARTLVALAGAGPFARALAGALAALAYAFLAGPIPSLARAVAAEAMAALARAREEALAPLQSLGVVAVALLAARPHWAFDVGFQLSCAATFGLVAIGGPLAARAGGAPRGLRGAAGALAHGFGAQCAALPWLVGTFHAFPWGALLTNLAAVPLAEGLLAAAALAAAGEALLPGAGGPCAGAASAFASALHALLGATGARPGALLAVADAPALAALAAVTALLVAVGLERPRALRPRRPTHGLRALARLFAGAGAVALALLVATGRERRPPPGTWWLVALDVGQGDATALAGAEGWWLVDAGPRSAHADAAESAVLPFLRWAGVRTLAAVVVTHDDGDHTGGLAGVRRGLPVRAAFGAAPVAGVPGPCGPHRLSPLARGDSLPCPPGARVHWPPRPGDALEAVAGRGDNAASLVLELGGGASRALLTGDADSLVEQALGVAPGVALLHVGHHGSGSSSGAAFLAGLAPAVAVVSCGMRNPYGHPAPGALERLAWVGAGVVRTDREGTCWFEFSPRGVRRLDWRRGPFSGAAARGVAAAGGATAARAP